MARSDVMGRIGTGAKATWGVALAILLYSATMPSSHGQMPLKARDALQKGNAAFSSAAYEQASIYYGQAQVGQKDLTPREIADLKNMIQQNNAALQQRRDGKLFLARAQELVKEGKYAEAGPLLINVISNPSVPLQDRQAAEKLKQQTQKAVAPMYSNVPRSYQDLLKQGRQALKLGDLDQAEMLARQAEKERPRFARWPWTDNPAKLLSEIQVARQRGMQRMDPMPNPKGPTSPFGTVKGLFRRDVPPVQPDTKGQGPVIVPSDGPILNPPSGKPNSSSNAAPKDPAAKAPEGVSPLQAVKNMLPWPAGATKHEGNAAALPPDASGLQRVSASFPQAVPNLSPAESKQKARALINQGYEALRAKDYDTARKLAYQAKELRSDLEFWEANPDKLLAEIQRVAPPDTPGEVVQTAAKIGPEKRTEPPAKADARALLQQARAMFKENKLEDADKLCAQSAGAAGARWGLFEDSPEKLRGDIHKQRTRRDREESVRLLAEARKLYAQGRTQEAKNLAWRAQQLHGPYSMWDLGDRPQKLLAEIERVEAHPNKANPPKTANNRPDDKSQTGINTPAQLAANTGPQRPAPTGDPAIRNRAVSLLTEARDLQKKSQLIEARQRALAAQQLNAAFGPDEDTPVSALKDLAGLCDRQVDFFLHRAGEYVGANSDPARFQKAEADLTAARGLAAAFGQDLSRIDQRAGWVQQVQASAGVGPPPALPPAAPQVAVDPTHQLGKDKLNQALLELRAGSTHTARRLAEEVYAAKYGVQQEAVAMLRSIDAEEHNQTILAAHNNAMAAFEAFKRRDYRIAQSILARVDPRLLNPQMQNMVREMSGTREMQPQDIQAVAALETSKGKAPGEVPGQASVGDLPPKVAPADDLTEKYRGMEDIVFQKLRLQSLDAQRKAIDLFGAGQHLQAIEVLNDYVEQLGRSQLENDRLTLLRKPIEGRIQQYRTLQAQKVISSEVTIQKVGWDEGAYTNKLIKNQEEVANLMKQYRALMKEGKLKEALACARKAKDLDPENVAADAGEYIAKVRISQDEWDKKKAINEDMFRRELSNDHGDYVSPNDPIAFNPDRTKRARERRIPAGGGILSQMHNPVERDIENKLSMPIASLNFKETPLKQVIADLHMLTGLNIVPDTEALQQASVSLEQPLNLMVENISLKSALSLLLKQVHLTYVIKNEVLNITTEGNAKGNLKSVTYAVADLVVPVDDFPLPDSNSLTAALDRHIANSSTPASMGIAPGPYALQQGQNVSAMGSQPGNGQLSMGGERVQKSSTRTIEELLINLIQTTVAPDSWTSVGGPGVIQYFPLGMALIVNQTQDVQEQVQDLLAALRKLQDLEVSIEMRLVSVSEAFFERIGMDFDMNFLTHNGQAVQNQLLTGQFQPQGLINRFTPSRFVSGMTPAGVFTPDLNIPINSTSFGLSAPPFGGYPGTLNGSGGLALGLAFLSDIQVFMFMEAAQGDRRTNVMQAPKITVFNGQTAFISVQDQQFFMLSVQLVPTPFGNIIFNPQQTPIPLGVSLRVTPVVSADRRFVRMNLQPQMTNLASATVPLIPLQQSIPTAVLGPGANNISSGAPEAIFQMFFQQPTFTQITMSTTVNVPDGGTVLLGGLKTLSESRNEFGPPILSKIPYISRLFKNIGYGKEAQSLMIMVTPRIIINEEEEQIYIGAIPPIPRF